MSAELDQLTAYGQHLVDECRKEVATTRVTKFGAVNASGRLAASLAFTVAETPTGYRLELTANKYVLTLLYGRNPGKMPPLQAIQQWIVDKGLVPHPDAKGNAPSITPGKHGYSALAYLIGRKIANVGNTVHVQGPPSPLFATLLNADAVSAELKSRIIPLLLANVRSILQAA